MTQFQAKVIEDSVSDDGNRLTTLQLLYPRFIHAEFMTHRVFSRNAASSRAIPVAKMIEQVQNNPAMPIHWGKNQPGMQASEQLQGNELDQAKIAWGEAARQMADIASYMNTIGLHKQVANRILEPFQLMQVIVTATEWRNFFELRDHPDAQPEIRQLARLMHEAMDESTPVERLYDAETALNWHLPYVSEDERRIYIDAPQYLAKLSAARCARVSYLTHDGKKPEETKDIELYNRLVGSRPLHASPIEHQAHPDMIEFDEWISPREHGNFRGWVQYRKLVEKAMDA